MIERLEDGAGERRVEFFEKLQIDQTDTIAVGSEAIAAGFVQPLNEAFGTQFGEIVSQGTQRVFGRGATERCGRVGVDFNGRETILSGNVREADQSMHQCELSGVIQFKARNWFSVGKDRRLYQSL